MIQKICLILIILMPSVIFAGGMNKKYSYKSFLNQSLKKVSVIELNNTDIYGSGFYQEGDPNLADIFPKGMIGVKFYRCNLDNVYVPPGNFVDSSCTHKRIKVIKNVDCVVDENKAIIEKLVDSNTAEKIEEEYDKNLLENPFPIYDWEIIR